MDSENKLNALMERVEAFQNREHKKNRKKIKNGFLSMLIVPSVFLVLMFTSDLTGTSKLIMLVVWIISMILIAAYLVVVEYVDHKLMNMMKAEEPNNEDPANENTADESTETEITADENTADTREEV